MITKDRVNHAGFALSLWDIIQVVAAKNVCENVAFDNNSLVKAANAWLQCPIDKENIEGEFRHFGVVLSENATKKKK